MTVEMSARRDWPIDHILASLVNEQVRVAARSFFPHRMNLESHARFVPVRDLYLPDNQQPSGMPVFFEGRLIQFERRISVVIVLLDAPDSEEQLANGIVCFRGKTAAVLRGPAIIELAFPFQVERLPEDPANYWRDIRFPSVQFELPFAATVAVEDVAKTPKW